MLFSIIARWPWLSPMCYLWFWKFCHWDVLSWAGGEQSIDNLGTFNSIKSNFFLELHCLLQVPITYISELLCFSVSTSVKCLPGLENCGEMPQGKLQQALLKRPVSDSVTSASSKEMPLYASYSLYFHIQFYLKCIFLFKKVLRITNHWILLTLYLKKSISNPLALISRTQDYFECWHWALYQTASTCSLLLSSPPGPPFNSGKENNTVAICLFIGQHSGFWWL